MDFVAIKDLQPGTTSVNVKFIVLETLKCSTTNVNQKIFTFKVADSTACVNCWIRGETGQLLMPGDIIRMTKCFATVHKGRLIISSGKSSKIQRMGDFCMVFNERLNMSTLPRLPTADKSKENLANGNGRSQKASQPPPDSTRNNSDDSSTTQGTADSTNPKHSNHRSNSSTSLSKTTDSAKAKPKHSSQAPRLQANNK